MFSASPPGELPGPGVFLLDREGALMLGGLSTWESVISGSSM